VASPASECPLWVIGGHFGVTKADTIRRPSHGHSDTRALPPKIKHIVDSQIVLEFMHQRRADWSSDNDCQRAARQTSGTMMDQLIYTPGIFDQKSIAAAKQVVLTVPRDIADEFHGINENRLIEVKVEGDPVGFWDSARMGQVLSNLMGNAIQHGDASSPVTVAISGKDPKDVIVTVHNFGTPIPPESQRMIFNSWMRGQITDGDNTHLGLGLYVAKLLVEAHGGEIQVASNDKQGTTFTVRLPRS